MTIKKTIYYASTFLLSLTLLWAGTAKILGFPQLISSMKDVGIDNLTLIHGLGVLQVLGGIGLWVRRGRPWAIHGAFFLFLGAIAAHIGVGHDFSRTLPALLSLTYTILSFSLYPHAHEHTLRYAESRLQASAKGA